MMLCKTVNSSHNYWRLLSLIIYLPYIKYTLLFRGFFFSEFTFHLLHNGGELRVGTHIVDEQNTPIAVSVHLCGPRIVRLLRKFKFIFPLTP